MYVGLTYHSSSGPVSLAVRVQGQRSAEQCWRFSVVTQATCHVTEVTCDVTIRGIDNVTARVTGHVTVRVTGRLTGNVTIRVTGCVTVKDDTCIIMECTLMFPTCNMISD